jgi:hypothetical protein
MSWRKIAGLTAAGITFLGVAYAFQSKAHEHTWREYPAFEYNNFPIPPDYQEKTEWAYARLMYPTMPGVHGRRGFGRFGVTDWTQGGRGAYWTMDYPRSDRHFSAAVRRLTRIHARSVEQPINLDDGDQYDWPWLYAVEVGHWNLTDAQVKAFREYLDRGGFFMCDDFHGTEEWAVFTASMSRAFPDRQIVEVPGEQFVRSHRTYEYDGYEPHWRGIYDDRHRLIVAICNDMDLGDSWEHADNPEYPQQFSALGIRIGVNYVVYAMTH